MQDAEHAAREQQVAEAVAICGDPAFWAGLELALKLLGPLREVMLAVRSERPLLGQVWPLWLGVRDLCMKVRGGLALVGLLRLVRLLVQPMMAGAWCTHADVCISKRADVLLSAGPTEAACRSAAVAMPPVSLLSTCCMPATHHPTKDQALSS
jgi:hypothetical protein